MIRRPPRSTRVRSSAASDVYKRQVARYTLLIQRAMFDLDRPIEVLTNGTVSASAVVKPDVGFMLEQAAEDEDRSAIYCARININVMTGGAGGRP